MAHRVSELGHDDRVLPKGFAATSGKSTICPVDFTYFLGDTAMPTGMPDNDVRIEADGLGTVEVPEHAYWGASTQRAKENFDISGRPIGTLRSLIWALGAVKKASAQANEELHLLSVSSSKYIQQACQEVMDGVLDAHFVVDLVQGGAGTSSNMNANEVIANRATEILRKYDPNSVAISPLDEVNRSQSTNDVYPTAVKLALLKDLRELRSAYTHLAESFEEKAEAFASILKVGRTQLQDAVPMTLGQEFGAFASIMYEEGDFIDSIVVELQETNLGGTAIGTGITSTDSYREVVMRSLQDITGMVLRSAPDLVKSTSDAGPFLTVSAALRRSAVKLSKICNDLRLLSSGPQAGLTEIALPAVQPGSSIMPGKVNPVIPEMVNQVAFRVIGTDTTITMAAEAGQLQLNAFEPIMTDGLMESIAWLTRACNTLRTRCVTGIEANEETLDRRINESVSIVTALTPAIGYMAAAELAQEALDHGGSVVDKVLERGLLTRAQVDEVVSIGALTGADEVHILSR